ncbi:MAG: type II toxin-antitoxin system VapC family toxin, partial [Clostridiales Family XIII bacterium]|nr:type II toxin-antitoxin system VapC family toxin [Clostridiales Family XIII bacterium]
MAEQTIKDILLDTHAFMWASKQTQVSKLSDKARMAIEESEGEVYVSALTAFEITNKYRRGKLENYKDVVEHYREVVDALGVKELPLTQEQAYDAGLLDWDHRDPFDRMIAAQARTEGLTLVTCDKAF